MANSLQRSIQFCQTFVQVRPLSGVGNFSTAPLEPALTIGDWVRQFMLMAPFAWRWNRASVRIPLAAPTGSGAVQDYTVTGLSDFGWPEKATVVTDSTHSKELVIVPDLAQDVQPGEPHSIAPIQDDGAGNITFRVMPGPTSTMDVQLDYQMASPSFTALTGLWSPVPDYLSYLYNQGCLYKAYEMNTDERMTQSFQIFLRNLIAANNGLTDSQVNLFMADRLATQREVQQKLGSRSQQPQQQQ